MKKSIFLTLLCVLGSYVYGAPITGFWKTIDPDSGRAQSVVAIYEYKGKYYGRMIGTYNKKGEIDDTIYHPQDRAPGVVGTPFYCGLDIIWNLSPEDDGDFLGKICDPQKGNIYNAKVWAEEGKLMVRGMWGMFGSTRTWLPFPEKDFNSKFKKPDVKKFVPVIPEMN